MAATHIGLPKGRGLDYTKKMCMQIGIKLEDGLSRYEGTSNIVIHILKFGDIAELLALGALDLGVTGDEWLLEAEGWRNPIDRLASVPIYTAQLCLLVPHDCRDVQDIKMVTSPFPRLAERLISDFKPRPEILPNRGTSEALVPDFADAAIDVVETGMTAKRHGLVPVVDYGKVEACLAHSRRFGSARAMRMVLDLGLAPQ